LVTQCFSGKNENSYPVCVRFALSAVHSIETSENIVTGTNGTKSSRTSVTSSRESFQKNPEIVEFPKSGTLNQNFREESQMERAFPVRNYRKFRIPCKVFLFFEFSENAGSFVTRNFRKFKPKFYRMESALDFLVSKISRESLNEHAIV